VDLAVTIKTPEGEPAAALTNIATAEGDVIVVGQAPQLTVRRALHGSVGGYCRKHARCPVVIVPPAEPDADARAA
jgi:nucleotide-binding universal stress UspA family protein